MARLEDVIDPSYIEGLAGWSLDEVRARREAATEVETGLSYLRRIVQGRLDIVVAERTRRQTDGEVGDVSDLINRLPAILADHVHAPGLGRLPALMGPGELDSGLESRVEQVMPAAGLTTLPDLDDGDLETRAGDLAELEREISSKRRALFDVIDELQSEVVRRYRTGEATVDGLLQ